MTKSATETTIHTIGLDIAKNSFSAHGFDAEGHTVMEKTLKRVKSAGVVWETATVFGGTGSLCLGALLGAGTFKAWP